MAGCHGWLAIAGLLLTIPVSAARAEVSAISGVVSLNGPPPQRTQIEFLEKEGRLSDCHTLHESGLPNENLIVSGEGRVANVFVYVRKGLARRKYAPPDEPPVLNQDGCMFRPRVQGIMTGQTLLLRNSDPLLHNVRALTFRNRPFNFGQPAKSPDRTYRFRRREKAVMIQCDLHPWMVAHIFVMDHPYFAVTDESGRFTISGLPQGNYTLSAWHEELGEQDIDISFDGVELPEITVSFLPPKKRDNVMQGRLSAASPRTSGATAVPDGSPRAFVKKWQPDDLPIDDADLSGHSAERGQVVFQAAGCIKCHVIAGKGAKFGPELTEISKRFKGKKLLEQILKPSVEINKDFQTQLFLTTAGKVVTGLVIKETEREIHLLSNPLKPEEITILPTQDIEQRRNARVSTMPESLLDTFEQQEILDLLLYLHKGGRLNSESSR